MKATVIILAYKQEKTIARTIESVLRQECEYPFEILVADDGSPDATRTVAAQYARRYPDKIRLMPKMPNKGIVDNYFDAVEAARGEYLGDCAGDDEWLDPHRLHKQIEALDANPDASAVCCDVESYDVMTGQTGLMRGSLFSEASATEPVKISGRDVLLGALNHTSRLPFVLSGAIYRRAPIAELLTHHPELLRCHDGGVEDVPLIAALGRAGDVIHLPFNGYRYYIDGESLSNNLSFEKEYQFGARVARMVRRLGIAYGLSARDQSAFFNDKIPYLAAQARHARRSDMSDDLRQLVKEWGLPMPFRARVHLWLLIWKVYR
ncbi:MAG: glycosyltransferase family 2 protein [Muribaculaceae bacterium]|nr:glycosyltransferase family 2 protein [Muribaculaceae bacterium]